MTIQQDKHSEVTVHDEPLLVTDNLTKRFGLITAVDDLSLTIPEDEITSIIGPNGAGKTTIFNLLTGKHEPDEGTIRFRGERIDGLPPREFVKRGIARSYQITNFFPELSVRENVRLGAYARQAGFKPSDFFAHFQDVWTPLDETDEILERIGLTDVATKEATTLSHGQQRYLEIGIALAADPDLLLLDEPTAGMSPGETQKTIELIRELAQDITIVLIEHNIDMVIDISDRIAVMNKGSLLTVGPPEEVRDDERVQEAYLGKQVKTGSDTILEHDPPTDGEELLKVEDLNTFYGKSHVLFDVSLSINSDELVALVGRNGAGKTTTLRSIMGITPPESGSIKMNGEEIQGFSIDDTRQRGISWIPEERRIFADLTVSENLQIAASAGSDTDFEAVYERFPRLNERRDQRAGTLSGGEQQMLAIARALLGPPTSLMMLDEPSEGLAPQIAEEMTDILHELNDEGVTILLVEQNASVALDLADRVYVIDNGQIEFDGTAEELRRDRKLMETYLGIR